MGADRDRRGFYGAAFLFPCVLLLNIGFIAAQLVIQAQSMQGVAGSLSIPVWIVILVVPAVVIGIFGYRWIHRVMQASAVIVGVSLLIMFVQGLRYGSLPAHEMTMARPSAGLFLAGVAPLVIDMLSFGPFVSDYTRYLPAATSGRRLFWCIYGGNVLATFIAAAIGAYLAALLPSLGAVDAVGKVSGRWALVIMAVSLINSDTVNAYTGAFQILSFRQHVAATDLSNFLDVLLVIFIPWSAVDLADYFVVRRAQYDVASFFTPGGTYGNFAWRGLLAYAVGLAAQWPFVSQPDYTGPLVSRLGGADISWVVGWLVAAIVYLALMSRGVRRPLTSVSLAAAAATRRNGVSLPYRRTGDRCPSAGRCCPRSSCCRCTTGSGGSDGAAR